MVVAGYLWGKEETAHVEDNTLYLKQQQAAIQPYTRVTLLEERELLFIWQSVDDRADKGGW